ncbi:MAG: redoxin domain-containing protein [Nannocystaceae bacterium]|nr:redoxin domain-containing protein [Nannocystaceae bacterium]
MQLGQLQESSSKFAAYNATLAAIVVDTTETNDALAKRLGVTFPILSDADLSTVRAYGVEHVGKDIALPATVVVNVDGTVRWVYVGDRPADRPLLPDVLRVLEAA